MSLLSESLFAVTGCSKKGPVTESDGARAETLPGKWRGKLMKFLSPDWEPEDFEMPPELDVKKTWDKLALGPSQGERVERLALLENEQLQVDYLGTWNNAVLYLKDKWPVAMIESPFGPPEQVEPSLMETLEARMLYAVIDDPTRMLDDLLSGVLVYEAVDAVRVVYPELTKLLSGFAMDEFVQRRARDDSWKPTYQQDQLLRVLFDLAPDAQIASVPTADGEQREVAPPKAVPKLDFADKIMTKSQKLQTQ